jgi:UDP-N-acetylglucosamine transferase subunit ALG13
MKCGHEVEIIDYKPDYLSNHYNLLSIDNPKWEKNIITKLTYLTLKVPTRLRGLKRKKAFDRFTSKYLNLTKSKYTSNNNLKKKLPHAEAYICGSDQIWNSLHKNGRDPAFYLDFVPDKRIKISYAASFATDTIPDEYRLMVKEKVGRLDGVSVREKSGIEILKNMNINNAVNVVDPVFLLGKDDWDDICTKTFKEDYILVYDFDNSDLIKKLATEISKEKGYKIYTINPGKLKYANKYFKFDGPETFVSLVKSAKFIISNSFHAAVFSVIYEKDFIIVNRKEAINTRMRDLLDDLNLKKRLVNENYNLKQVLRKVNYEESIEIIDNKIKFSKEYLKNNLSINKGRELI